MTTYEVNPAGRADPVPGTDVPPEDDPNVMCPGGLISLEDITLPWARTSRVGWPWDDEDDQR